ncbi:hypothetical protein J2Z47_000569 [Cohnella thailandensis]|nr:hypothetical protein [Cohnella thailandensis]
MIRIAFGLHSRPFTTLVHYDEIDSSIIPADSNLMNNVSLIPEVHG